MGLEKMNEDEKKLLLEMVEVESFYESIKGYQHVLKRVREIDNYMEKCRVFRKACDCSAEAAIMFLYNRYIKNYYAYCL